MKILHIYKSYYPYTTGGVEKYIHILCENLGKKNIKTAILTTKTAEFPQKETPPIGNTPVSYYPASLTLSSCPFSFSLYQNYKNIVKDFDLLHYHFPWPFGDLIHLANQIKKPYLITYHSDIVRQKWLKILYTPLMHLFLKKAKFIIASSKNYQVSSPVLKKYGSKTQIIPFGLEKADYQLASPELVNFWKNKVGENFFLFVGVLRYYKGLDFLLEAAANSPLQVVIAGSGPEQERLLKIKKEKKLDNVTFTGYISELDKSALYQLCRASVSPSHIRAEAFCISLLESLVYGKPAISTELNTGTSFVNQHNISGLVIPPKNPLALKEAMLQLLFDEELYQRLVQGTQIHFNNHFTADLMVNAHIDLYQQIIMSR